MVVNIYEYCDGFRIDVRDGDELKTFAWDHNETSPGRIVSDALKYMRIYTDYEEVY